MAGCGSQEDPAKAIDEKLAAAEKAADRAEKAQRLAEQAVLANVNNGSGGATYDEPAESRDLGDENGNDDDADEDQRPSDNGGDDSNGDVASQDGGSGEVVVPRVIS